MISRFIVWVVSTFISTLFWAMVGASFCYMVGLLFATGWGWVHLFRFLFWGLLVIDVVLMLANLDNDSYF